MSTNKCTKSSITHVKLFRLDPNTWDADIHSMKDCAVFIKGANSCKPFAVIEAEEITRIPSTSLNYRATKL